MLHIFVGYDGKVEPVAYHAFCQSVIEHSSIPVSFTPLALSTLKGYEEKHVDGSNAFIYSRFLVPSLCDYKGTAVFFDGDQICTSDVAELLKYPEQEPEKAVWVVKHDYKTKHPVKYLGAKNDDYPRKNWSSVILWNCHHWQNKKLTPELVMESTGSYLHRFSWLEDRFVGDLPVEWNWLESEYVYNKDAKLIHHTLGTPCFKDYQYSPYSQEWWSTYHRMIYPLTGDNKISNL
jgi:lipopolysaccharide biosynthesis glycosyltransferase